MGRRAAIQFINQEMIRANLKRQRNGFRFPLVEREKEAVHLIVTNRGSHFQKRILAAEKQGEILIDRFKFMENGRREPDFSIQGQKQFHALQMMKRP